MNYLHTDKLLLIVQNFLPTMSKQVGKAMFFWMVAVIVSLGWNLQDNKREYENLATKSAQALFAQIVLDRAWNAGHGGVYVPVTEVTQPNPYLKDPLRDVNTLEGVALTKINPAFMTRQISEIAVNRPAGIQFHITSLKPIRPANKPADWESQWLQSFENGSREESQFVYEGAGTLFRYMAPLFIEKGCMKCHGEKEGYKLGDIRGGISVTLPFGTPKNSLPLWFSHGIALLFGLLAILIAEAKRQKNEILLKGTLESTADGILVISNKGEVVQSNSQFAKLWGIPDEIIKKSDDQALLDSVLENLVDPQSFLTKVQELYESTDEDFDTLRFNDGRIIERYSYPLMKKGKISGRVWSFRDITERKKAEEELHKLSMATEQSPASVVITDPSGCIEYVNQTFTQVTGYSFDEAVGHNHRILQSDQHDDKFYSTLWNTIKFGKVWHGEIASRKKNGEIYWERVTISPIRNHEDEITHFIAIKEDITEKKIADEALETRATKLADAQLAMLNMMEDLDEAKDIAEEATKAKSDFLANMSHEIRTPMNAIIGMSHLALKTNLTPKQQGYIGKVQLSANALLGIINDILDFSKIEAGKLEMESANFMLEDVLDNLANLIATKAEEKKLELLFHMDAATPNSLIGDPLRLGQILINLANNAVKFTEEGEIVVSVVPVDKNEGNVTLQFSVQDSGIGLTEEQRAKLFQPFSQADSSTTRKYGGTGLGLTISKRLCEMMGGEIWVETVQEGGSIFVFTAVFGLKDEKEVSLLPDPDLRGKSVLVVDDNKMSRDILQDMLESMSFVVYQAVSGEEAVRDVVLADNKDHPFDVVYMDWRMSGMDGIAASKRIKAETLSCQPKIIMVTAYGREEIMQQVEDIKLDSFLIKPVKRSVLFDATMQAFGRDGTGVQSVITDRGSKDVETLKNIRGARILLVEDNEINQQVAQEILEQAYLVVEIANDGKEAVEMAEKNTYDIILMDIQMPVMGGFEATQKIRSIDSAGRNIPIVAMTAHAMAGDREKSIAAGMNDHITKPIDPNELLETLLKYITVGEREVPKHLTEKLKEEVEPAKEQSLPEMFNLDTKTGLTRVGGNERLYRSLLVKFYDKYPDSTRQIRDALTEEEMELGIRLAHTVKGVAGNLGAKSLQKAAADVERAIKNGDEVQIDGLLDIFEQNIQSILAGLKEFVISEKSIRERSEEKEAGDPIKLAELLHLLLPFIQKQKPKPCKEIMAQIGESSWPMEFKGEIRNLQTCIAKYKFKDARPVALLLLEKLDEESS